MNGLEERRIGLDTDEKNNLAPLQNEIPILQPN
jgi:hypothetical protein